MGEFSRLVRSYRSRAGLTQEELAERGGLSTRTVANIERGRSRRPHRETVALLAGALGLAGADRDGFLAAARGPGDPDAAPGSVGCQLPAPPPDLVCRVTELARVADHLTGARPGAGPRVVAVSGPPGVGKSALILHAAHRMRPAFPDGQLYAWLGGAEPAAVLAGFLRALGVSSAVVPTGPGARAALYRSRLAGRRILVVLDDAADERQVRPLLPGTVGAGVLVTSRRRLVGLEAAHRLDLSLLTPQECGALLTRAVGEPLVRRPAAARAVIVACAGLPLALRIAGARLAEHPEPAAIDAYAARLTDERTRLNQLRAGDLAVRSSVALTRGKLDPPARRAFTALAALTAPTIPAWLAAPLLDAPLNRAERAVEQLADARLMDVDGVGPGGVTRYRTLCQHAEWDTWQRLATRVAAACAAAGDQRGHAAMAVCLGRRCNELGQQAPLAPLRQALAIFERLDDTRGQVRALSELSFGHRARGRLHPRSHHATLAVTCAHRAVARCPRPRTAERLLHLTTESADRLGLTEVAQRAQERLATLRHHRPQPIS